MAKTNSETGHVMNKANFNELISVCNTMGTAYRPSREVLKVANLHSKLTDSTIVLKEVSDAEKVCNAAIGHRVVVFDGIGTIASRIVNGLVAIQAPAHIIKQAKAWNRKLAGRRAGPVDKPEEGAQKDGLPSDKQISVSQLSFDRKEDHFSNLVDLVKTIPEWTPNEEDMTADALVKTLEVLVASNQDVRDTYNELTNKRIKRDDVLYHPLTGLVAVARNVKSYLRSVFTVSSPEFKMVSKLEFRDNSR